MNPHLPAEKCPLSSPLQGGWGVGGAGCRQRSPKHAPKAQPCSCLCGGDRAGCLCFTGGLVKVAAEEENKHRSTANSGGEGQTALPTWVLSCCTPCTCACVPWGWQRDGCVGKAGSQSPWGLSLCPQPSCCPPLSSPPERECCCVIQRKPPAGVSHLGLPILPGSPLNWGCGAAGRTHL